MDPQKPSTQYVKGPPYTNLQARDGIAYLYNNTPLTVADKVKKIDGKTSCKSSKSNDSKSSDNES